MTVILENRNYKYGVMTTLEDRSIPRGAASDSLNWLTKGDKIELRRGSRFLGTEQAGNGRVTSVKRATDALGVDILFGTFGKKAKYYKRSTSDWVEISSDLLGSAVVDTNGLGFESVFFSEYTSPAGNQIWLNSPNCAGFYKIMVSNPGDAVDQYNSAKNFKGNIKIDTNRTLLFGRKEDRTGLYGSYIDVQAYTTVTNESIGTGDGATVAFSGTLAFKGATKRTCFGVSITAGAITFSDNFAGTLTGSDGSTGTINYATGAWAVTFVAAPANLAAITATYQWEDSTSTGIADFTKSGTRTAGQGFVFRQDEAGGDIRAVNNYNQIYYCMHLKKTWVLNIGSDDTTATNLPYRERVGIPNERASVETGDGIYYIDDSNKDEVRVRLLTYDVRGSSQVIPVPISNNINLNDYLFDQAASDLFGDLVLFSCATKDSIQTLNLQTAAVNNRTLVYNKLWKSWDVLDYGFTCSSTYDGAFVAGDSTTNNFMELFSGLDDFDTPIVNFWEGDLDDLDIIGLKKVKQFRLQGQIGPDQKIKVSISLDGGPFVEVGYTQNAVGSADYTRDGLHTYAIQGNGSYVDRTQSVNVGAEVLGRFEIGGGSSDIVAYNFDRLFSLRIDKFQHIKIRYEAVDIGYAAISTQSYWDIREKERKAPSKYRG